jgi:hypothetical protein
MRPYSYALATLLTLAASATPASAGIPADELCTGDPCVISGTHTLEFNLDPVIVEFGNRAVVLAGTLDVGENDVLLSARTFEISGAVSGAPGLNAGTGSLELVADNIEFVAGSTISLRGTNTSSGGFLDVFAFDSVTGTITADTSGGLGGGVSVTAVNGIELTGSVLVGDFGSARFDAGCSLSILPGTTMSGIPSGFIEFFSGGEITLAGTFDAGEVGEILAVHRPDQPAPVTTGAAFDPDLIVETDELQAECMFGPGPTPTPTHTLVPSVTPTATATMSTPTPTSTPRPPVCLGDCDGDGQVTVDEIIIMVNIALGTISVSECEAGDIDSSGTITVDEIVTAVNLALDGCPTA